MESIRRNECGFAELFRFAEKHYKVDWSSCNDLFFKTSILTWRSYNDFTLEEVTHDITWSKVNDPDNKAKISAFEILAAFMKAEKVKKCRILST